MSDSEIDACAQSITLARPANAALVRAGAVTFWAAVAVLIAVRAFVVDPAVLKPVAAAVPLSLVTTVSLPGARL